MAQKRKSKRKKKLHNRAQYAFIKLAKLTRVTSKSGGLFEDCYEEYRIHKLIETHNNLCSGQEKFRNKELEKIVKKPQLECFQCLILFFLKYFIILDITS